MLDKRTDAVLKALHKKVPSGFAVLTKTEISSSLPPSLRPSDGLERTLSFLQENDYIEMKYQDKDDVCLCLTVKADSYLSSEQRSEKADIAAKQLWILFIGMFLAAFLGSFLATLFANIG